MLAFKNFILLNFLFLVTNITANTFDETVVNVKYQMLLSIRIPTLILALILVRIS